MSCALCSLDFGLGFGSCFLYVLLRMGLCGFCSVRLAFGGWWFRWFVCLICLAVGFGCFGWVW